MKHTGLVSLCLAGRVRGERSGLKVTVRREPTAGLSLYAWSSPSLISLSLGHFGKDFTSYPPTHPGGAVRRIFNPGVSAALSCAEGV